MGDPVVRFEIGCRDSEKTSRFYEKAFDWTVTRTPAGADIATGADKGVQGAITALGHEPHNYVMVYMEVADADDACARIKAEGGRVTIGPLDIPGGKGRFAWFEDPEGNTLGVFQPPD